MVDLQGLYIFRSVQPQETCRRGAPLSAGTRACTTPHRVRSSPRCRLLYQPCPVLRPRSGRQQVVRSECNCWPACPCACLLVRQPRLPIGPLTHTSTHPAPSTALPTLLLPPPPCLQEKLLGVCCGPRRRRCALRALLLLPVSALVRGLRNRGGGGGGGGDLL